MYLILFYLLLFTNNLIKDKKGYDERLVNPYDNDKITIDKINEQIEKKILLDLLQSTKLNIYEKINILNKNKEINIPKPINLYNGGLLDDWNFDTTNFY